MISYNLPKKIEKFLCSFTETNRGTDKQKYLIVRHLDLHMQITDESGWVITHLSHLLLVIDITDNFTISYIWVYVY